jgi:hypothetical protein
MTQRLAPLQLLLPMAMFMGILLLAMLLLVMLLPDMLLPDMLWPDMLLPDMLLPDMLLPDTAVFTMVRINKGYFVILQSSRNILVFIYFFNKEL